MPSTPLVKSALLAIIVTLVAATSWEIHLRQRGVKPDFDNDADLWTNKRKMVYEPSDQATVILGSSRAAYDIDIPTYEHLTGKRAVQLSMDGSSPRTVFDDLANDPKFKGKVILDVTEMLFYNNIPFMLSTPAENLAYYEKETPAQKVSFTLDVPLEANLVFLNQGFFSLNALLNLFHLKDRPGFQPDLPFPLELNSTDFNRQNRMTDKFLIDTSLQNRVRGIWMMVNGMLPPPIKGKDLVANLQNLKENVTKIRKRGGDVIFIRTPSSGPVAEIESKVFPKSEYWDKMLTATNCKGVHYKDYPELSNFFCPEFSHLSPRDAMVYTKHLVTILKTDKNWN